MTAIVRMRPWPRSFPVIFCLLAVISTASAQLTIQRGGERVVSFQGGCGATMYSPSLLHDPDPAISGRKLAMYTAGGPLVDPCSGVDYMAPQRFGDKIWYHYRDEEGIWRDRDGDAETFDAPILDRRNFSWMNDEQYLLDHPNAYVGHISSPSVVKIGNRYFMSFVATINDPNLCAGEHHFFGTSCGSCRERWSYFVSMWALSDDGMNWRVYEGPEEPRFANRALNAAILWKLPIGTDVYDPNSMFRGPVRTAMLVREEEGQTYFYIGMTFSGRQRVKTGMIRIRYDETSEWGFTGDPQAWMTSEGEWRTCRSGELPPWLNDPTPRGSLFQAAFANVSETDLFPGYRYIATLSSHSLLSEATGNGFSNIIAYQLSDDLVNWSPMYTVASEIPFFADGLGYDGSVSDPVFLQERSLYRFFFATADGRSQSDESPDGIHDCNPENYPEWPTAMFIGMGIFEGTGRVRPEEKQEIPKRRE